MLETNPTLKPADIKDILARTATPLPKYYSPRVRSGNARHIRRRARGRVPTAADRDVPRRAVVGWSDFSDLHAAAVSPCRSRRARSAPSTSCWSRRTRCRQVSISRGAFSTNDFGLQVYDGSGNLAGQSNYLNAPGLTGRFEEVVLQESAGADFQGRVPAHGGLGTPQTVFGSLQFTQAIYPTLRDRECVCRPTPRPRCKRRCWRMLFRRRQSFLPNAPMSRYDLAAAFVRAGLVPQYLAGSPMFTIHATSRREMRSRACRRTPRASSFTMPPPAGRFYPNNSTTKLVAAVAWVKAAGLEGEVNSHFLPMYVTDRTRPVTVSGLCRDRSGTRLYQPREQRRESVPGDHEDRRCHSPSIGSSLQLISVHSRKPCEFVRHRTNFAASGEENRSFGCFGTSIIR